MRKWMIQSAIISVIFTLITMQVGRAEESKNKEVELYAFNPTEIVKQLRSSEIYSDANRIAWEKEIDPDGTEWWHGDTEDELIFFRITPVQIMMIGGSATAEDAVAVLLAASAVNQVVFPKTYDSVNQTIFRYLLHKAAADLDEPQSTTHKELYVEVMKRSDGILVYSIKKTQKKKSRVRNSGIGISRDSIISVMHKPEVGLIFARINSELYSALTDGNLAHLLGPSDDLREIMIMAIISRYEDRDLMALAMILGMANVIDNSSTAWVSNQITAAFEDIEEKYKRQKNFGQRIYKFAYSGQTEIPNVVLTVTAIK